MHSPQDKRGIIAEPPEPNAGASEDGTAHAASPPLVIRGQVHGNPGAASRTPRTKVDYLSISFDEDLLAARRCISEVFAGAVSEPFYGMGPGKRHFERSHRLTMAGVPVGVLLSGGETQRGRACLDLSGMGCGFVTDWKRAEQALLALPGRRWLCARISQRISFTERSPTSG
jgi:hypothetical protein